MTFKVLLQIPLSPYSGYGKDGIGLAQSLMRSGADVYLDPTAVQTPLPADLLPLLGKTPVAPFDMVIQHVDPMTMEATDAMRASTDLLIGWTMWEWSSLSNAKNRSKFKKNFSQFDAILAYDQNTKDALSEYYRGPIPIIQGGFDPEPWEYIERDWHEDTFRFIQIGVLNDRKNPFASISAFQKAREIDTEFRKHATLALKTSTPGIHSKVQDLFVDEEDGVSRPKLRVFYDTWPEETVKAFYGAAHVLLAPSRGEGKNLPALEFLATGGPVIATNWGGHLQWMNSDYALPIDYTLRATDPQKPKALSAEVDVDHMADQMIHLFHNRDKAKRMGLTGSQVVRNHFSWEAVVDRLFIVLANSGIEGGQAIFQKYITAGAEQNRE